MRVGQSYDVHRLVKGQRLMLDNIDIPYERGLLGYSDADVLLHATSNTLLGAAAFGDVDAHFPDSGPIYGGADSAELLRVVGSLIHATDHEVGNIDNMVVCQAPKLALHISAMRAWIAEVLALPTGAVGVRASSKEHVGFTGRGEGITMHAVCLLTERTK